MKYEHVYALFLMVVFHNSCGGHDCKFPSVGNTCTLAPHFFNKDTPMAAEAITFRIILEQPVVGATYGLQSGSGHTYEVLQKQVAHLDDLIFEFALPVKRSKEGTLVLHGPIIQGPPGSRFLYLDIGSYAKQDNALVNGRIKIPLPNAPDEIIRATGKAGSFVIKIKGTKAKDGSPALGSIKPFEGWKLK